MRDGRDEGKGESWCSANIVETPDLEYAQRETEPPAGTVDERNAVPLTAGDHP